MTYWGWSSVYAKLASRELIVHGNQWPMLVYANQEYDPEDPWNGLFRSQLLIWVSFIHSCATYVLLVLIGQAYKHIYLTQFCREGIESNQIWKRSDTWHEASHYGFPGIHSNTSAFSSDIPLLHHWSSASSTLHCHPSWSSAGLTLSLTQKDSTITSWTSWMIKMIKMMFANCWTGGIGKRTVGFWTLFSS